MLGDLKLRSSYDERLSRMKRIRSTVTGKVNTTESIVATVNGKTVTVYMARRDLEDRLQGLRNTSKPTIHRT